MTLIVRPGYGGAAVSDPDAQAYLQAVEVADNQALEQGVQQAVNQFVIGCKADGIWNAIKASCILAGARTRTGALVPLVGAAPTSFNFVDANYDRKTGLVGDGSTKYLDSNRNNNADPQNSQHLSIWASTPTQEQSLYISSSATTAGSGASGIGIWTGNYLFFRSRSTTPTSFANGTGSATGLIGVSRNSSSAYIIRASQANTSSGTASQTSRNGNIIIFGEDGSTGYRSAARLAFYSIGESLDLALLDARVTALITAFGVAIP
jgi:hypothetical protein